MSEDNKHYRLVFTGNLLPGRNSNKVVSQLQEILHLDREQAERLVAGKHNQINKKLTLDRAEKLRLLILKQGAECVLLPIEDSFITTQQLPKFVSDDDDSGQQEADGNEYVADRKVTPFSSSNNSSESISNVRQGSMPLDPVTRLKYLFIIVLLMVAEAIVIWNIRPGMQVSTNDDLKSQENVFTGSIAASEVSQNHPARKLNATESETDRKLKSLSARARKWFSEQESITNPADVNWIWIQGDRDISVREMNDSWGNTIRYYGANDGFELRSSGIDGKLYTKDDIFRKTVL